MTDDDRERRKVEAVALTRRWHRAVRLIRQHCEHNGSKPAKCHSCGSENVDFMRFEAAGQLAGFE